MTIHTALDSVDMLKPNKTPPEMKIAWLSELDGLIWHEIVTQHEPWPRRGRPPGQTEIIASVYPAYRDQVWPEGTTEAEMAETWYATHPYLARDEETGLDVYRGYDVDTDPETVLIAPFPYDEIYGYYLMTQVDLQNQEIAKYNNDKALFNHAYDMLSDYWTRNYMPRQNNRELRL